MSGTRKVSDSDMGVVVTFGEPQPPVESVEITFTLEQFRAVKKALLGDGELKGAWYKIVAAENLIEG